MPTGSDSRKGPSPNYAFENIEWVSGDWQITSKTLVFSKRYFVYYEHQYLHTAYCFEGAFNYVMKEIDNVLPPRQ